MGIASCMVIKSEADLQEFIELLEIEAKQNRRLNDP